MRVSNFGLLPHDWPQAGHPEMGSKSHTPFGRGASKPLIRRDSIESIMDPRQRKSARALLSCFLAFLGPPKAFLEPPKAEDPNHDRFQASG